MTPDFTTEYTEFTEKTEEGFKNIGLFSEALLGELCVLCGSSYFLSKTIAAKMMFSMPPDFTAEYTEFTEKTEEGFKNIGLFSEALLGELYVLCGSSYVLSKTIAPKRRGR
jgi:hypothetical protein